MARKDDSLQRIAGLLLAAWAVIIVGLGAVDVVASGRLTLAKAIVVAVLALAPTGLYAFIRYLARLERRRGRGGARRRPRRHR